MFVTMVPHVEEIKLPHVVFVSDSSSCRSSLIFQTDVEKLTKSGNVSMFRLKFLVFFLNCDYSFDIITFIVIKLTIEVHRENISGYARRNLKHQKL